MDDVLFISDLETLKTVAEPTRVAILEQLSEPQSVTQLAGALQVPRTRLYHHMELLRARGLIDVVEERRVGAMTELIYAPTAKTYRLDPRLLDSGELAARVDALTTLLFDATKSDVRRALLSGQLSLESSAGPRQLAIGRSIAFLTPERADNLIRELEALVARFDAGHVPSDEARPFAFSWVFYPASRTIR